MRLPGSRQAGFHGVPTMHKVLNLDPGRRKFSDILKAIRVPYIVKAFMDLVP